MKKELEKAIKNLTEKAVTAKIPVDAMQYTQAALNAVQSLVHLMDSEKRENN